MSDSYLQKVDTAVADLFADWNIYSSIFATILLLFVVYPWLNWQDPDTHPFLLARQASTSPVRQEGQSATYRSIEIPYGYPLRAGLGVKDPGAPKWSSGRNGDLRDIWRHAVRGPVNDDGSQAGERGKVLTVLGRERVIEHSLDDMTLDINVIGKYVQESQGQRVAICLANSTEMLSSIFAAAFYGFSPILVPHDSPTDILVQYLLKSSADFLIVEAGVVELQPLVTACPSLRHVIWVATESTRHMDWNVVPKGAGSKVEVATWHELVEERRSLTNSEVLAPQKDTRVKPLSTFWPSAKDIGELVEYTSENLVAGTAALLSALPRNQRIGPQDLLLPTTPLRSTYPLCLTFAALFSHASVALNSVAGEDVDLGAATMGISPTIIVTSSKNAHGFHQKIMASQGGLLARLGRYFHNQKLQSGSMPASSAGAKVADPALAQSLSKLRLLFVAHSLGDSRSPQLHSTALSDLRILLGARIGYALTAPEVAGAISQSHVFDYRESDGKSHFGPPLSSVEILLIGEEEHVSRPEPTGTIIVKGPAVREGEAKMNLVGRTRHDNTLSLP